MLCNADEVHHTKNLTYVTLLDSTLSDAAIAHYVSKKDATYVVP